jgi:anti-anti-sigma factor
MSAVHPPQTTGDVRARLRCARHDVGAGVVRVSLSGELDASSSHDLDRVLRAADDDAATVVIDLDELASVDEAGAAVLRAAGKRARRRGRRVVAVNAHAQVQEGLELAGVERELKLVATSLPT